MAVARFGARVVSRAQQFTSSGTWTCPAGVTYAKVTLIGAGGGGAGCSTGAASGGGNGGSSSGFNVTASGGLGNPTARSNVYSGQNGIYGRCWGQGFGTPVGNTGRGGASANFGATDNTNDTTYWSPGQDGQRLMFGASVLPGTGYSITIGAGGSAGTNAQAGSSGYCVVEWEE